MKLLSVASARPNFVKLAAVDHAVRALGDPSLQHVIVHTGQHYDPLLSDVFFKQLNITKPKYNLGVHGGTREEVIEKTMIEILPKLEEEKPDMVVVYGDVNGAVGAARAAKKLGIKLAHVEAGLRSFDTTMPEELNRVEVDSLANILLCSEESGMDHLKKEGVQGERYLVGNTMIDTLIRMEKFIDEEPLDIHARKLTTFAIATIHRPSNVDDEKSIRLVMDFLKEVGSHLHVFLPVHPRLKLALERYGYLSNPPKNVELTPPKSYLSFLHHLKKSTFVITDSGGIQEEAMFLKKRCFTLRRNTERPSTIEAGSNVLIDPANESDRQTVLAFAEHPVQPKITPPALWDGKAGERIVELLRKA